MGTMERTTCDACGREDQRCEKVNRSGMDLWLCIAWRACIAAQPALDVMAGGVRR